MTKDKKNGNLMDMAESEIGEQQETGVERFKRLAEEAAEKARRIADYAAEEKRLKELSAANVKAAQERDAAENAERKRVAAEKVRNGVTGGVKD